MCVLAVVVVVPAENEGRLEELEDFDTRLLGQGVLVAGSNARADRAALTVRAAAVPVGAVEGNVGEEDDRVIIFG